jgi:MFS family permease
MITDNPTSYRRYLLGVLLVILACNNLDRIALGILLQDIKVDLNVSDTQLGLLSGIAFALFYSVMGIPIARWADRGNRVTIISLTTAVWSVAVALCGAAGSFVQLLLIRIGVAVGEAGCIPPAHSLISDYFARAERPRALGFYMLGAPLSMVVGYFLSGWLNTFFGWRVTFVVLGLPGLALAMLALVSLREPRRAQPWARSAEMTSAQPPRLKEVAWLLWRNATFRHLLFCFAVLSFFSNGIAQWQPAFFMRSYGLSTGELGTWMAVTYGLCGAAGTYAGGALASRRAAGNERLQLQAMAVACCGFGLVLACVYLSSRHWIAFGLIGLAAVGGGAINGPLFATIQAIVPQHMRAVSIALIYLFANLIGMGLGPLIAGALSDVFRPWAGEESLRYALLALCPGYVWAAWHLWHGSRTVGRDLEVLSVE